MKRFFYIDLGYTTFGIEATDDVVTTTAPIGAWMKGFELKELRRWLLKKKAIVKELKTPL